MLNGLMNTLFWIAGIVAVIAIVAFATAKGCDNKTLAGKSFIVLVVALVLCTTMGIGACATTQTTEEQGPTCLHCQKVVTTNFCPDCGHRMMNIPTCTNCGDRIGNNDQYCGHCGAATPFNIEKYPYETIDDYYHTIPDENKITWV